MKNISIILFAFHSLSFGCLAQDFPPVTAEQQLENLTDEDQAEPEDDSYLLQLVQFRKNPINLNTADAADLEELKILSDLQIASFFSYRKLFGKLIDIYELQAVPTWDVFTIHKILPFVTINNSLSVAENFHQRTRVGENSLLVRMSQFLEKAKGFTPSLTGNYYQGGRQRVFLRYRYQYKNLLQYGLVADKDAGEEFFKGAQKLGFDFYSFHFFARKISFIDVLALGDFTVNMGQGLIQWQGLAFKKSGDVTGIKRQSPILRPYNSAGEFNFNRGAGITIKKRKFEATLFASSRKLSANIAMDTTSYDDIISSFLTSGYHRTKTEIDDRNNLLQRSFGGNISYKSNNWQIGINGIYYNFSHPLQKKEVPYNYFAIKGSDWYNYSIDYSFTRRNFHFFGEAALDKKFNTAFINGLLVSVDPRVDLSFVQRTISEKYQAVNGNAFTENTYPSNETGWYGGISIHPATAWRVDAYGDFFKFPWLKFSADAPTHGLDLLAQVTYTPNKQVEIYTRFKNELKQENQPGNSTVTNYLVSMPRQNWRTQISCKINSGLTIISRVEVVWYDHNGVNKENGFLMFTGFNYKPLLKPYSANLRLQYFETAGYNSRLYAFENDVLFSFSIPQFSGKGYRYYLNFNYDINKRLSFCVRWAQTIYSDQNSIGSGLDETKGNTRSEVKMQALWYF